MPDRPDEISHGTTVHLRRFRRDDLGAVLEIERSSFPQDPYPARLFLLLALREPALFLVAERDARVVGYAIGALDPGGTGRIVSIAVDPGKRRRGVGRRLSEELLQRLERAGADRVVLETRVGNEPAIGLWRQLGFEVAGTLPGYYGDGGDALLMRRSQDARDLIDGD